MIILISLKTLETDYGDDSQVQLPLYATSEMY